MDRYAARHRILASLGEGKAIPVIAEETGITDARLIWHLRQMRDDNLVASMNGGQWTRTIAGSEALANPQPRADECAFPQRIIDDFEDAINEAGDGLYGRSVIQSSGEHRGRLSQEQAMEFNERLMNLIEEYFSPGRGDRTGIKHGLHWVLTPIDLHPIDED